MSVSNKLGYPTSNIQNGVDNDNMCAGFNMTGKYKTPPAEPTFWETDVKTVDGTTTDEFHDVIIHPVARMKIAHLMQKFSHMEWLAYLVGSKETSEIYDIVLPLQEVTIVHVDVLEGVDVPIIGVIHSHHDMGNTFSHTDDEFINGNHDISLCVSHTGITGQVRWKMEDGDYMAVTANVLEPVNGFDPVMFDKEIDDNISQKTYRPQNYATYYKNLGGGAASGIYDDDELDDDVYIPPDDDALTSDSLGTLANRLYFMVKDEETNTGSLSEELKEELGLLHNLLQSATKEEYSDIENTLYYNNTGHFDDLSQEIFDIMEEVSSQNIHTIYSGSGFSQEFEDIISNIITFIEGYGIDNE